MGITESYSGGGAKKYDPKYAKKVKEGGKIADQIRKLAKTHHETLEVPTAEAQLEEELKKIDPSKKK
jgi:hypothetical protein